MGDVVVFSSTGLDSDDSRRISRPPARMLSTEMQQVLKEISQIRDKVERIEQLIEERFIGIEDPLPDEIKAIEEYTKNETLEYTPLEETLKER